MEQSLPSEANSQSVKKFPSFWKQGSLRVHKGPPLVPILSQINAVYTFSLYFPEFHSNIILISTPSSSKWSLSFRFRN